MNKTEEYRAIFYNPNKGTRNWLAVQSIIIDFFKSNKTKLVVQFDTPDTIEMRKKIAQQEEIIRIQASAIEWALYQDEFYCEDGICRGYEVDKKLEEAQQKVERLLEGR